MMQLPLQPRAQLLCGAVRKSLLNLPEFDLFR
jgi:hypothetical protein